MSNPRGDRKGFLCREPKAEKIIGSFTTDAVPATAITFPRGTGWTATVVGAVNGRFLVTLARPAYRMISCFTGMEATTGVGVDMYAQAGDFTPGVAPTFIIRTVAGGAEADPAVGDRVHFELTVYGDPVD
mgnify:CR=1 FL=1